MRSFVLSLIIGLFSVLCLFSCADEGTGDVTDAPETTEAVETTETVITTAPDDETDEPITKVDYLTSVDEEVNGFSVKGQKYYYEYNDEDFLIFDVENLTEKVQAVEIKTTFYDKKGNVVAEDVESFPDFAVGDVQTFIFRPYENFEGFTYELSATEYSGTPWFDSFSFDIKGASVQAISDNVNEDAVPSLCAELTSSVSGEELSGVGYTLTVVAFDSSGKVQGIGSLSTYTTQMFSNDKSLFLRAVSEDEQIDTEGYSFKVMHGDVMYTYYNAETPAEEEVPEDIKFFDDDVIKNYDTETVYENVFAVKEKKLIHDDKEILLLRVENTTDKTYSASITVNYHDENGKVIKTQVQSYDWFVAGYYKYFLFRPGKSFENYSYDIEFAESDGEVPIITCGVISSNVSASYIGYLDENMLVPHFTYKLCTKNEGGFPVQLVLACLEFDENGELFDIRNSGMPVRLMDDEYLVKSIEGYNSLEDGLDNAYRFDKESEVLVIILDAEIVEINAVEEEMTGE